MSNCKCAYVRPEAASTTGRSTDVSHIHIAHGSAVHARYQGANGQQNLICKPDAWEILDVHA